MIAEFAIGFVLTLGGPSPQLDINGWVMLEMNVSSEISCGFTPTPGLSFIGSDPKCQELVYQYVDRDTASHEAVHQDHFAALGPAFLPAYILTGGEPFEDYIGDENMWTPGEGLTRNCPAVRINGEGVQFQPCWRF